MKLKHYIPLYFFLIGYLSYLLYDHSGHYVEHYGNCLAYFFIEGFLYTFLLAGGLFVYRKLVCSHWP